MNIYQRYFSKSLILFSILLFLIVLLLESNFGFKLFFNVTNYFLWGLKTKKISGNWRDFTLKKITYNFSGLSIKADNIHILIDPISLFKINKIFKRIEIKNLICFFNEKNLFHLGKKTFTKKILKKNIFFKNIILKKIYFNKILIKSNHVNVFLSNVHSGVKLTNNNLTIFNTYINFVSLNSNKNNQEHSLRKKQFSVKNKVSHFLSVVLNHKKILCPIKINLLFLKCKKIQFFDHSFKNILFMGTFNKAFIFKLKFNNFCKFSLYGKILLNNLNHPLYINLYMHRFSFPINKNLKFVSKSFSLILKGTVNQYNLSLKNIVNISGMPSVILNIFGGGSLKNIYLSKIHCIPLFKKIKNNKLISLKKNNDNQCISQLKGNINILNNFNKGINNINVPDFNITANIINKKFLILGSLYYNEINNLKIPKIMFFSGKNVGFISGSISKNININSSININNLNYFIPNLKGAITSTLNIYGFYLSPITSGFILGEKLNWNNIIYLNSMKMIIDINSEKKFTKNIFLTIKKIKFFKFYMDFLNLNLNWNERNQKLYFFLKNKDLTIDFIVNGRFDYQTGAWKGCFEKINILTFNKTLIMGKNPIIYSFNKNTKINQKKKIKDINSVFDIIKKSKKILFSSIFNSSVNFKANLFFKVNFISKINEKYSNIKVFLCSNNIQFKKRIKHKNFIKNIDSLKLYINFKKDCLLTKLIIYPLKNQNSRLFGFFNIYDIFNKKNIRGKYFLFNCPCFILNFFISNSIKVKGTCTGYIKFLNTLYQPNILADIHLKDFCFKSDKILKYIISFFYPSLNPIKYIKINQSIFISKGDIFLQLNSSTKNNFTNSIEWNCLFNSNQILFFMLPKIKLKLSSQINLHYFLLRYDLIGYLKSCLFYFKINEKNFIF